MMRRINIYDIIRDILIVFKLYILYNLGKYALQKEYKNEKK